MYICLVFLKLKLNSIKIATLTLPKKSLQNAIKVGILRLAFLTIWL